MFINGLKADISIKTEKINILDVTKKKNALAISPRGSAY